MDAKQKRWWMLVVFTIVILAALSWIIFKLSYTKVCDNEPCFSSSLSACERAEFLRDSTDARWYYKILGPSSNDGCEVYVKLAQLRRGSTEILALEGKDMTCYIPYSVVESPQKDIERCHGPLREEIQTTLIQKMHAYLLENLGEIKREFTTVI